MRKRKFILVFIMVFAAVLTACGQSSSNKNQDESKKDTYVIVAGHAAAKDHFAQKSFEKFKELVEKNSNGRIKVEIHPGGELGGEREMVEQILLGDLTMMAPASAPLDAVTKSMAVWDLPYLFTDRQMAHRVLDGEVGQEVLDSMSDKGLVGLAYWENGFRHLTNSILPIASVSDFAGINMRTLENPMQIKAWSLAGANATPIAFTELYAALENHTVDAQETPLSLMYSMKFYEVQKYLSLTGHTYSPWPVVMNKQFFDSLPDDLQQVVRDAAYETREYNRQLSKEDEEQALQLLKDQGMEVLELTEAQKQEFKHAMSEIYSDVKNDVGEELFDKLMKEVSM
ncbi:DctP family TRAP transporter solute-binding subunit [Niallia endozanthoxylica]|uniref:DctP family TRAP transporter solute-binding subunit n=1 Tax=Niallia endozanthoxylica TaxID=2036016 RepID=A0A5J5IAC9_9BACI|nr:DctP family TRAP transporter solute-binding subunit [Niallia endozanthoxylica]KAA9031601.1 DctP family TRAP transporter solute-binding subunit [Niallia endozanthoxylica]